jgi:hypothetical protein
VVGIGQFADENGCDEVVRYLEFSHCCKSQVSDRWNAHSFDAP